MVQSTAPFQYSNTLLDDILTVRHDGKGKGELKGFKVDVQPYPNHSI